MKITTIARNDDCDIYVDANGNLALVDGLEACAQIVNAKMRTITGELQLNMNGGLPYMQTIFRNRSFLPLWESAVLTMLNGLFFVQNVNSFICNMNEDSLYYTAEIQTIYGKMTVNG